MILTKEQTDEMLEAAKPLIKWLNDATFSYPHCHLIVDQSSVQMVEDVARNITNEFLHG